MASATDLRHVQELLEARLTEEMMKRLTAHAIRKAQRLYWQGTRDGHMPGGNEAKDIVQNAIMKVWRGGKRNWNPEKDPDLFLYLKGVVDSDISNLVTSEANGRIRLQLPDPTTQGQPPPLVCSSREEEELTREEESRSDRFFFGFHEYLNDETDLQRIVDCIFEGVTKPRKIAEKLGLNVKEIYSARKRLRLRLDSYRKTLAENETADRRSSHA